MYTYANKPRRSVRGYLSSHLEKVLPMKYWRCSDCSKIEATRLFKPKWVYQEKDTLGRGKTYVHKIPVWSSNKVTIKGLTYGHYYLKTCGDVYIGRRLK